MPSKILYVEDCAEYAELAINVLKKNYPACEIRLTDDLRKVEELLKVEPFDLVLSDFSLKGFDARDVLKACADLAPGVPLILLTGMLSDELAVDLLKAGVSDYILKDRVARLPAAINAALADREKELELNAAIRGLAEGEARYRQLFEFSSDLIFLVTMDGTILDSNPAFQAATGYRPRKRSPVTAGELAAETGRPEFLLAMKRAAERREPEIFEAVFVSAQGKRLLAEGSFHAREKDGEVMYLQGVFHDVTAHRNLEERLRQAQKMEAVGRLAGGIAHDFNNILCAIEGYATLALDPLKDKSSIKSDLGEIRKAVSRATGLIKQLLVFSRKQALQKKPCDLNALVKDMQAMITRLLGENVRLELDLGAELPSLLADTSQLDQALLNLVVNARDAMPGGGAITVRTRMVALEREGIRSPRPEDAGPHFILLSVRDTGTGISKEALEHIFEPFFTTKERGKGTGLGLATVYGAAKQHNGWVTVDSEPGRGSEFSVFLPVKPCGEPGVCPPVPRRERRKITPNARVLIIEDDHVLSGLSVKALAAHGYSPAKAGSIAEALAMIKDAPGAFDIIFSDMVLGDGNIMTVAGELARLSPAAGFIFTSGYLEDKNNWDFMNSRDYSFIPKPFSVETLLKAIDETLEKKAWPPAAEAGAI